MFLKDLVGKMAIRTMEPVNPFDPCALSMTACGVKSGARHLEVGG